MTAVGRTRPCGEPGDGPGVGAVAMLLAGVSHTYRSGEGALPVLDGVELSVSAGEIVGVGGPSGSGKSTLLRIAAGLTRPTRGAVYYAGGPAWTRPVRGRPARIQYPRPGYVGMVFQDPVSSVDPRWTVGRCVTEPLRAPHRRAGDGSGPVRSERDRLASEALERVGLGAIPLGARPDQLSVGQLQRVVLARALLARPAVLLADEPTSALDVTSGAGVLHLLRRFADDGAAVLIISHDRGVLGALCDRQVELRQGVLSPCRPAGEVNAGSAGTLGLPAGLG